MRDSVFPKMLAIFNLILGLFLWFLFTTDYSLAGTIPDILFPPIVGIISTLSLPISIMISRKRRLPIIILHLPSIIGGGLYILVAMLMLIPPFTLGALFAIFEISGETEIQRAVSPDGTWTAYVYFRGVGAYSTGNGRIFVRVRHRMLPFLERDIFYLPRSYASEDSTNYIEWRSNNVIYISETKQEISIGVIKRETPRVIAVPYYIFRTILTMTGKSVANQQQTIHVRDVPIYPGTIVGNQFQYLEQENTAFRSFNIEREDIEQVVRWYEKMLSTPPWTLIKIDRHTETYLGLTYIQYCIQAIRKSENEQRTYFWEFMGTTDRSHGVHVNIGTPHPVTDTCKTHIESP